MGIKLPGWLHEPSKLKESKEGKKEDEWIKFIERIDGKIEEEAEKKIAEKRSKGEEVTIKNQAEILKEVTKEVFDTFIRRDLNKALAWKDKDRRIEEAFSRERERLIQGEGVESNATPASYLEMMEEAAKASKEGNAKKYIDLLAKAWEIRRGIPGEELEYIKDSDFTPEQKSLIEMRKIETVPKEEVIKEMEKVIAKLNDEANKKTMADLRIGALENDPEFSEEEKTLEMGKVFKEKVAKILDEYVEESPILARKFAEFNKDFAAAVERMDKKEERLAA